MEIVVKEGVAVVMGRVAAPYKTTSTRDLVDVGFDEERRTDGASLVIRRHLIHAKIA
jgi:hypothetical protein